MFDINAKTNHVTGSIIGGTGRYDGARGTFLSTGPASNALLLSLRLLKEQASRRTAPDTGPCCVVIADPCHPRHRSWRAWWRWSSSSAGSGLSSR
jgi:hypothetical protein